MQEQIHRLSALRMHKQMGKLSISQLNQLIRLLLKVLCAAM